MPQKSQTFEPGSGPAVAAAETTSLLFARTMGLVVLFLAITGGVSYLFRDWVLESWWVALLIVLAIFGMLFWSMALVRDESPAAVVPATIFAALEGTLLGPTLQHYVKSLGPGTVVSCIAVTMGVTATCGLIGYTVNIAYRKIESLLMIGLLGLVIYGVYAAFASISAAANMTYCVIGMVVFVGFFIVDFARLKDLARDGEKSWGVATFMAVSIYLDILNFLLYLLRAAED